MDKEVLLKDILDILNSRIEIYYKSSYVGEFTKEELKKTGWINDRIVGIESDEEPTICIYLSDVTRKF